MPSSIVGEEGLGDQQVQEPTESAQQDDFAWLAIRMWLRASQVGQQLHLGPVPADPQVGEKAGRHPAQSHQGAYPLPIEELHLLPAQAGFDEFEGVLHTPDALDTC